MNEVENIIELATAVRESTLKRLALIPEDFEEWRLADDKMSIADIVQHLIDSDYWLIEKLRNTGLKSIEGIINAVKVESREDFNVLIEKLRASLKTKIEFIFIVLNT